MGYFGISKAIINVEIKYILIAKLVGSDPNVIGFNTIYGAIY